MTSHHRTKITIILAIISFLCFSLGFIFTLKNQASSKSIRFMMRSVIKNLQSSPNPASLFLQLETEQKQLWFSTALIKTDEHYAYTSHNLFPQTKTIKPFSDIVQQAFQKGFSRHNQLLIPNWTSVNIQAIRFNLSGQNYVLLSAIPSNYETLLFSYLITPFCLLQISSLLLFAVCFWHILSLLITPISSISQTLEFYIKNEELLFPTIVLDTETPVHRSVSRLRKLLNIISSKINLSISSLIQQEQEKQAILESLIEAIIVTDKKMQITYTNKKAKKFLSKTESSNTENLSIQTTNAFYQKMLNKAFKRKKSFYLIMRPHSDQKRYLHIKVIPRQEGGLVLVLQDRTDIHKMIERDRDFIANASHELKTPITIIRGFAETLKDCPPLKPELYTEITEKILTNCKRMEALIKNLLLLASTDLDIPPWRLHPYNLLTLVQQAKQTLLSIYPQAKVKILAPEKTQCYAKIDQDLFFQAVWNLLENAAKYSSPSNQNILITIEKKPPLFILSIQDQGMGIAKADSARIFERFYVANKSHARRLGGSGLGLSIVASIVRKHQGKIKLSSKLGKGSSFTIFLPIKDQ